jgi:hypothetical protein
MQHERQKTMGEGVLLDMVWGEVERHGDWSELMWETHWRLGLGEF